MTSEVTPSPPGSAISCAWRAGTTQPAAKRSRSAGISASKDRAWRVAAASKMRIEGRRSGIGHRVWGERRGAAHALPVAAMAADRFVRVRGAREHNLKSVDVDIPRDALVVFSGISGSGKSSLAFGTLYAEAQRRYFESVAPYARRLIDQVGVPDVDAIDGLPPAVPLPPPRGAPSVRSSVGSVTTLSSLVRMLYSRA